MRKKYYRYLLVPLLFLCLRLNAENGLVNPGEQPGELFRDQEYQGELSFLAGKVVSPLNITMKANQETGELQCEFDSRQITFSGVLDRNLQTKESTFKIINQELIKFYGHDKRVTTYDEAKKNMTIKYYLHEKETGSKTLAYDPRTMVSDTIPFYLQGMLLKKTKNFKAETIITFKGMKLDVDYTLEAGSFQDFKQKYNPPEKIKVFLPVKDEVLVYIMKFTGAVRLFYPHCYYYVFEADYPHRVIAYWGGAPKEMEYQIYTVMQ